MNQTINTFPNVRLTEFHEYDWLSTKMGILKVEIVFFPSYETDCSSAMLRSHCGLHQVMRLELEYESKCSKSLARHARLLRSVFSRHLKSCGQLPLETQCTSVTERILCFPTHSSFVTTIFSVSHNDSVFVLTSKPIFLDHNNCHFLPILP